MVKSVVFRMQILLLMMLVVGILSACGSEATPTAVSPPTPNISSTKSDLVGTVWAWQNTSLNEGDTTAVTSPSNYTIEFKDDGTVNVKADCNTGSGPYTVDGYNLTTGPLAMTTKACSANSQDIEFLKDLNEVATFLKQDKDLYLELRSDAGAMKFSPSSAGSSNVGDSVSASK